MEFLTLLELCFVEDIGVVATYPFVEDLLINEVFLRFNCSNDVLDKTIYSYRVLIFFIFHLRLEFLRVFLHDFGELSTLCFDILRKNLAHIAVALTRLWESVKCFSKLFECLESFLNSFKFLLGFSFGNCLRGSCKLDGTLLFRFLTQVIGNLVGEIGF